MTLNFPPLPSVPCRNLSLFCRVLRQYSEIIARTFASPITTKTPSAMNIFEQMLALAAIAVSGAALKTVFSAVAIRRRLK